jgi:adenine-specific DNA methylase
METKDKRIMAQAKKLIEVAMPIKEVSAESVRDKSIRHGHISTLHLWWARRPLPVCRAVVFASLVPDPLDENCPQAFRDAVEILLGSANKPLKEDNIDTNAYKPYDDIPYTAAIDKMEDSPRNRLLMFIGKYSNEFISNEKVGKKTVSGKQLSDYSLIKWDNKNNDAIINKARKLIWVAHNSCIDYSGLSAKVLLKEFEIYYKQIKNAEYELYSVCNRHIDNDSIKLKTENLNRAIENFLDKMPKVFDPFAGGGAIPLEAARLGCKSFGNDINPVAHIIQKGSLEFPQKYGKPIKYSKTEFLKLYGQEEWNKITNENFVYENGEAIGVELSNRLSFDVEYFAKKLLAETEKEIGHLYPDDEQGNKPVAYYWARVGTCINPSCKAQVPLLKRFVLCDTPNRKISLQPTIKANKIEFTVVNKIVDGTWMARGNMNCPCCGNTTDVKTLKNQFINKEISHRLLAIIWENKEGKSYRIPSLKDIKALEKIPTNIERPREVMPVQYTQALPSCTWGLSEWGEMFTDRQMTFMNTIIKKLDESNLPFTDEYKTVVVTYLGIMIDRIAQRQTSFGIWDISRENLQAIFGRQAISMMFDYPESNPFSNSGGGALNQLEWIVRYLNEESKQIFYSICNHSSSGDVTQFNKGFINATVTDPPYYDAIAYADLSDFFYVWLKRSVGKYFVYNFATPLTPKTEECTALKHHRDGDVDKAKQHFEDKLKEIFTAINFQISEEGIVSIMFAHQSTEAWTTLCNSILRSSMNITGSWALDTEYSFTGLKQNKAFLSSSVTVSCKPILKGGIGDNKDVRKAIEKTVAKEVEELYRLGFRGADLLTACFGQAVSEFGKYEKVEKADGSEVTVAELLEMARESAFNALLKGFDGDDFTKFYIGWLQLYSFVESEFDDAAKFSRVGLSINVAELFTEHILIKNGNKQTLGTFDERIKANKNIGDRANNFLIDLVHRAMALYKGNNRNALLQYIGKVAAQPESNFWRVITSLCEILPAGCEDHKQALGLLTNKDSLIRESKTVQTASTTQTNLFES